ncbi:hypothetical protein FGRMN_2151 [Fusarium graminum]|nr:hypothetical protein FGRMN_2151 [Fusarium graminum]
MYSPQHLPIPRASLLGLPQELRDEIYRHYFKVNGGYVYHGDSDKLVEADGEPIDLALRLSCRAVADETRSFPTSLNPIKFSTVYRKDWQKKAIALKWIIDFHRQLIKDIVMRLRRLVTSDMYCQSQPEHHKYMPVIKNEIDKQLIYDETQPELGRWGQFQGSIDIVKWHSTYSLTRTVAHILRLLAEKHPEEFAKSLKQLLPGQTESHSPLQIIDLPFEPWEIPSLPQVMEVAERLHLDKNIEEDGRWYERDHQDPMYAGPTYQYQRKYYFSATTLAIRTLRRMTRFQRLCMRKLIVDEDRISVAYPESHPIGLISFCTENPRLHVENQINLWKNYLIRCGIPDVSTMAWEVETIPHQDSDDKDDKDYTDNSTRWPHQVSRSCATTMLTLWIKHVFELVELGMPPSAYTFFLDGNPFPHFATTLFTKDFETNVVWLTLNTDCMVKNLFAPHQEHQDYPFMTRSSIRNLHFEDESSSLVQCNFALS